MYNNNNNKDNNKDNNNNPHQKRLYVYNELHGNG